MIPTEHRGASKVGPEGQPDGRGLLQELQSKLTVEIQSPWEHTGHATPRGGAVR